MCILEASTSTSDKPVSIVCAFWKLLHLYLTNQFLLHVYFGSFYIYIWQTSFYCMCILEASTSISDKPVSIACVSWKLLHLYLTNPVSIACVFWKLLHLYLTNQFLLHVYFGSFYIYIWQTSFYCMCILEASTSISDKPVSIACVFWKLLHLYLTNQFLLHVYFGSFYIYIWETSFYCMCILEASTSISDKPVSITCVFWKLLHLYLTNQFLLHVYFGSFYIYIWQTSFYCMCILEASTSISDKPVSIACVFWKLLHLYLTNQFLLHVYFGSFYIYIWQTSFYCMCILEASTYISNKPVSIACVFWKLLHIYLTNQFLLHVYFGSFYIYIWQTSFYCMCILEASTSISDKPVSIACVFWKLLHLYLTNQFLLHVYFGSFYIYIWQTSFYCMCILEASTSISDKPVSIACVFWKLLHLYLTNQFLLHVYFGSFYIYIWQTSFYCMCILEASTSISDKPVSIACVFWKLLHLYLTNQFLLHVYFGSFYIYIWETSFYCMCILEASTSISDKPVSIACVFWKLLHLYLTNQFLLHVYFGSFYIYIWQTSFYCMCILEASTSISDKPVSIACVFWKLLHLYLTNQFLLHVYFGSFYIYIWETSFYCMCILEASTSISDKPVSIACVFWKLLHLYLRNQFLLHVYFGSFYIYIWQTSFYCMCILEASTSISDKPVSIACVFWKLLHLYLTNQFLLHVYFGSFYIYIWQTSFYCMCILEASTSTSDKPVSIACVFWKLLHLYLTNQFLLHVYSWKLLHLHLTNQFLLHVYFGSFYIYIWQTSFYCMCILEASTSISDKPVSIACVFWKLLHLYLTNQFLLHVYFGSFYIYIWQTSFYCMCILEASTSISEKPVSIACVFWKLLHLYLTNQFLLYVYFGSFYIYIWQTSFYCMCILEASTSISDKPVSIACVFWKLLHLYLTNQFLLHVYFGSFYIYIWQTSFYCMCILEASTSISRQTSFYCMCILEASTSISDKPVSIACVFWKLLHLYLTNQFLLHVYFGSFYIYIWQTSFYCMCILEASTSISEKPVSIACVFWKLLHLYLTNQFLLHVYFGSFYIYIWETSFYCMCILEASTSISDKPVSIACVFWKLLHLYLTNQFLLHVYFGSFYIYIWQTSFYCMCILEASTSISDKPVSIACVFWKLLHLHLTNQFLLHVYFGSFYIYIWQTSFYCMCILEASTSTSDKPVSIACVFWKLLHLYLTNQFLLHVYFGSFYIYIWQTSFYCMCILEASTSISDKPVSIACVFWKLLHLYLTNQFLLHVYFGSFYIYIWQTSFYCMCILEASTSISDKPVSIACVFWKLLHLYLRNQFLLHVYFGSFYIYIWQTSFYCMCILEASTSTSDKPVSIVCAFWKLLHLYLTNQFLLHVYFGSFYIYIWQTSFYCMCILEASTSISDKPVSIACVFWKLLHLYLTNQFLLHVYFGSFYIY